VLLIYLDLGWLWEIPFTSRHSIPIWYEEGLGLSSGGMEGKHEAWRLGEVIGIGIGIGSPG
jgi:hypothetical protein